MTRATAPLLLAAVCLLAPAAATAAEPCGVSRASLLTGQWMARHGNRAFDMFATPWEETFPARLRARGYWVGHVGKWHNGAFPAASFDLRRAFAVFVILIGLAPLARNALPA